MSLRLLLRQRTLCSHSLLVSPLPIPRRSFQTSLPSFRDSYTSRRWDFWRRGTSGKRPPHPPGAADAPEDAFSFKFSRPKILWPAVKIAGGIFLAYEVAVILTLQESLEWKERIMQNNTWMVGSSLEPGSRDLSTAKFRASRDKWQAKAESLQNSLKQLPKVVEFHTMRIFVIAANSWLWSGEAKQVAYMITGVNTLVFIAWCIPRLRPAMQRHFSHDIVSGKSYTMLTSVFSHASAPHLFFNCLALISFAMPAYALLGNEQVLISNNAPADQAKYLFPEATPMYHFLSFFIAAGLFSSLVSHAAKAVRLRLLLRNLAKPDKAASALSVIDTIRPSLGASGAIYSMVAMTALSLPHTSVNILLIPIAIPISTAVGGMVILDMVGILRGWKMFDHWAHLGGAAFGALAFYDGGRFWAEAKIAAAKLKELT